MTTARDIIKRSMQKIGVLVKGEPPSDDEAQDALASLNALISSWSNDSSTITSRAWETFTLSANDGTYTMGSGGDFNTTRPTRILGGYIRIGGNTDLPLEIISDEQYNSISFKGLSGIPQFLNYDNAYPIDNIRLYPIPSAAYPIFIMSEKPATEFATLDTVLSLPSGWERALIYNLALELAPEYGQQPDQSIAKIAGESLGSIRAATIKARPMRAFPNGLQVRNIYTGWGY